MTEQLEPLTLENKMIFVTQRNLTTIYKLIRLQIIFQIIKTNCEFHNIFKQLF
jgi:hypothetical protein